MRVRINYKKSIGIVFFVLVIAIFLSIIILRFTNFYTTAEAACQFCYGETSCHICQGSGVGCTAACKPECISGIGTEAKCCDPSGDIQCPDCGGCNNTARCQAACPETCEMIPGTPGCVPPACDSGWEEGSAPEGWMASCKDTETCSGTWASCRTCSDTRYCWLPEPSTAPGVPTTTYICVNGTDPGDCRALSTDPNQPTTIGLPAPTDKIYVKTNDVTVPPEGRDLKYLLNVDNRANPLSCSNPNDYCPGPWHTNPYSVDLRNLIGIAPDSSFAVYARSSSLKKCKNDRWCKSGGADYVIGQSYTCDAVVGYFAINSPPVPGPGSVTGPKVCSTTHTGSYRYSGANNPFDLALHYEDPDGYGDLGRMLVSLVNSDNPDGACPGCSDMLDSAVFLEAFSNGSGYDVYASSRVDCGEFPSQGTCDADSHCQWNGSSCEFSGGCNAPRCYQCGGAGDDHYYFWEDTGYDIGDDVVMFIKFPAPGDTGLEYEYHPSIVADPVHQQCLDSGDCLARVRLSGSTVTADGTDGLDVKWKIGLYDTFDSGGMRIFQTVFDQGGSVNEPQTDPCGASSSWINTGNWLTDFDPPDGSVVISRDPGAGCGALGGDEACLVSEAYDNGTDDSGLKAIGSWYYKINGNLSTLSKPAISPGDPTWSGNHKMINIPGGASLEAGMTDIEDVACNVVPLIDTTGPTPGMPWMRTEYGDVYATDGFSNPIQAEFPDPGDGLVMSKYWIGSGNLAFSFGNGEASFQDPQWKSSDYENSHAGSDWYGALEFLASQSICHDQADAGECAYVEGAGIGAALSGDDGIYYVSDGATLSDGDTCDGSKVIFVAGDLNVEPQFNVNYDADDACLFVVSGGVDFLLTGHDGADPADPDVVNAAFIVDGTFNVPDDNDDRLEIKGFVIANEVSFGRDLGFDWNTEYPAEYIEYDPRYLYLLRNMLGQIPYEDLECGIVTGSPACDWPEE